MGWLNFNDNGIAIIIKHEPLQYMIPLFFGIEFNSENNYIYKEKHIIYKQPFVLFKPKDSIDFYKNKRFIFYYFLVSDLIYNDINMIIDYKEDEWKSKSV